MQPVYTTPQYKLLYCLFGYLLLDGVPIASSPSRDTAAGLCLLCIGAYGAVVTPASRRVHILMVTVAISGVSAALLGESREARGLFVGSFGVFFSTLCLQLLATVGRRACPLTDRLAAAANAYFMAGLVGGFAFALIEFIHPGAVRGPVLGQSPSLGEMIYYSFMTLTTVGYGDYSPLWRPARTLAVILSMGGQIYLAFLVALLVGRRASDASS